jgi:uncharacterized membrane protein
MSIKVFAKKLGVGFGVSFLALLIADTIMFRIYKISLFDLPIILIPLAIFLPLLIGTIIGYFKPLIGAIASATLTIIEIIIILIIIAIMVAGPGL